MKILVADDHPLYRDAACTQLRRLFPEAEVDEASSLDEGLELVDKSATPYNLFLIDFHMPGMSLDAVAGLVARHPQVPVAVISGTANTGDVRGSIESGARGFIPKTATADHFASAIRILLAGGTSMPAEALLPQAASAAHYHSDTQPEWLARLSPRELDVLRWVAQGISNKQIGRELNLAEVTVKLHLRAIFRKIGAKTRAEAAVLATKAGLG